MAHRSHIPLSQWVKLGIDANHYTPDFVTLQAKFDLLPIFVYGSEQNKYSDHSMLRGATQIGVGFLPTNNYTMYRTPQHQPFVLFNPERGVPLRGELYLVPPTTMAGLDMYHTNGIFSRRSLRTVHWYRYEERGNPARQWYSSECYVWLALEARFKHMIEAKTAKETIIYTGKTGQGYHHWRLGDDEPNRINNAKAM